MNLVIDGLYKEYGKKQVLKGVSFTFQEGKIYSVLGRNGVGKTTLFNCIGENVDYSQGKIELEKEGQLSKLEFDDIGIVTASPVLPDFLTGYEFINFFVKLNQEQEKRLMTTLIWCELKRQTDTG